MYKDPTEFRERFARWKKGEQVYENGRSLPSYQDGKERTYIGGQADEARNKYWNYDTRLSQMTDSVANQYGINPKLLKNRLNNEGFVDFAINNANAGGPIGANLFNGKIEPGAGFELFGTDDTATYINDGKVKLINESWEDALCVNEKGRTTYSADGITYGDNIGITAATLKYMRDAAKKNLPGASDEFLDNAAATYYTRGIVGGQKFIQNGGVDRKAQVHSVKRQVPPMIKKPQPYKTTTDWNSLPHFSNGTWDSIIPSFFKRYAE